MITDEQARWIALFFLLGFMDEKTAIQASHKTVAHVKAAVGSGRGRDAAPPADLIRVLRKVFEQHRKMLPRNRPVISPETQMVFPEGVELGPWAKFQKDAPDGEVIAVILSKVLNFSDQEIADGLNLSLGTVRYRIGKGVRQLGTVNRVRA